MARRISSRSWLLLHSWLAMPIWVLLLFVCLTGTIATVSTEILWLLEPATRSPLFPTTPRLPYESLAHAVVAKFPNATILGILDQANYLAVQFHIADDVSPFRRVYVNPFTAEVQGIASSFDFKQFMLALHGWLLMPRTGTSRGIGWYIVSVLAIPLLGSLITGLFVYKKFWRFFLKPKLRIRHGARVFWGDLHRLAGLWSIWFVAAMGVTGIWFLADASLREFGISVTQLGVAPTLSRDDIPLRADGLPPQKLTLDELSALAEKILPGARITQIVVDGSNFTPNLVVAKARIPFFLETLDINPYDGNIERVASGDTLARSQIILRSLHSVHVGDFAGIWSKLIWFSFGIILSAMVFSGFFIWSKRTIAETKKLRQATRRDADKKACVK